MPPRRIAVAAPGFDLSVREQVQKPGELIWPGGRWQSAKPRMLHRVDTLRAVVNLPGC